MLYYKASGNTLIFNFVCKGCCVGGRGLKMHDYVPTIQNTFLNFQCLYEHVLSWSLVQETTFLLFSRCRYVFIYRYIGICYSRLVQQLYDNRNAYTDRQTGLNINLYNASHHLLTIVDCSDPRRFIFSATTQILLL